MKIVIAPDSFKNTSDIGYLEELIGKSNLFYLSKEEKNNMYSNIFSISPNVVISDTRFSRLNKWLQQKDILVVTVARIMITSRYNHYLIYL